MPAELPGTQLLNDNRAGGSRQACGRRQLPRCLVSLKPWSLPLPPRRECGVPLGLRSALTSHLHPFIAGSLTHQVWEGRQDPRQGPSQASVLMPAEGVPTPVSCF